MNHTETRNQLSLEQFVQALNELTGPADLDQLRELLGRLEATGDLLTYRDFSPEKYQRNLVAEGPWFEALLLCFESGQRTPIHDHAGSACGVRVIQGTATETIFETTPDGWLYATESSQLHQGGVVGSVDMDIHQLSNLQTDQEQLVTLHVYSPPLGEVGNYSIVDNTCQRVRAKRNRQES